MHFLRGGLFVQQEPCRSWSERSKQTSAQPIAFVPPMVTVTGSVAPGKNAPSGTGFGVKVMPGVRGRNASWSAVQLDRFCTSNLKMKGLVVLLVPQRTISLETAKHWLVCTR